jgi:hypothetical protein
VAQFARESERLVPVDRRGRNGVPSFEADAPASERFDREPPASQRVDRETPVDRFDRETPVDRFDRETPVDRFDRETPVSAYFAPASARPQEPAPAPDFPTPSSEVRLITRPQWRAGVTNEAWARSVRGSPVVTMSPQALKRLPLDHRAGFVLSLMDGSLDLEMLVELSGMSRDDALTLVRNLADSGVVEFR